MILDPPVIVVHGGAGRADPPRRRARMLGCQAAAQAGAEVLRGRGAALDAVEVAVAALEDDPLFNAGTGAAPNAAGHIELDAAIMDGESLAAGAVGAVAGVPNPIHLARRLLDHGRHVLLVGEGAHRFAWEAGVRTCDPAALRVAGPVPPQDTDGDRGGDTVGAVALDTHGGVAAATSTGGTAGKHPGRVGDTPLIGAGTYAEAGIAVSCTGLGEAIMRTVLAYRVAAARARGQDLDTAAHSALRMLAATTSDQAGVIAVTRDGGVAYCHNAQAMPVAWADASGNGAYTL